MTEHKIKGALSPYRALDLTDEKGFLAGRILADFGADVIKVEKPGGDPSRNISPFYHDIPDPEKSLYWFAYNANKRGITLNLEDDKGREIFLRLIEKFDIIIESFSPGHLDRLNLNYRELHKLNLALVMASITPFGQSGPYSNYKTRDIVSWSMGGMAYFSGYPDRAPLRVSFPQSYLHAGAAASTGILTALYFRELTRQGQFIDVSIHESVVRTLMNARMFWDINHVVLQRAGIYRTGLSAGNQRVIWQCKDGYVTFSVFGGIQGASSNKALVNWMETEGIVDPILHRIDWKKFDMATATKEQFDRFGLSLDRFFNGHTMQELYQGAVERGIMLYPVYSVKELSEDPQLLARTFWEKVYHDELSDVLTYPGSPFVLNGERLKTRRRAPLIGEHNPEIYAEIGLTADDLANLSQKGVI